MGASEIPPFLLFCLCCQSCSKLLPSSVLFPLWVLFLAFTCARKCLLLKPLRLPIFISQGSFKCITSLDVQENMKVQVHLLPCVAQYGKQHKSCKTRVQNPLCSVLCFWESQSPAVGCVTCRAWLTAELKTAQVLIWAAWAALLGENLL